MGRQEMADAKGFCNYPVAGGIKTWVVKPKVPHSYPIPLKALIPRIGLECEVLLIPGTCTSTVPLVRMAWTPPRVVSLGYQWNKDFT